MTNTILNTKRAFYSIRHCFWTFAM